MILAKMTQSDGLPRDLPPVFPAHGEHHPPRGTIVPASEGLSPPAGNCDLSQCRQDCRKCGGPEFVDVFIAGVRDHGMRKANPAIFREWLVSRLKRYHDPSLIEGLPHDLACF